MVGDIFIYLLGLASVSWLLAVGAWLALGAVEAQLKQRIGLWV
jgi:hypothetical protein